MNIDVKTIFARYSNIKLGKAMDDEGQSLSDVETVLNSLGVALRTDKQHFDDFDNVIQKVASGWSKYNDIQKSEIATALAGTRQRESFLILMEKFGRVQELNTAQTNSAGNSLQKYSVYLESTEAKANKLKNSFQILSMSMFNSDLINSAIGGLNNFVNILNATANSSTSTKLAIAGLTISIIALSIAIKKVGLESVNTALLSFIPNLVKATISGQLLATATNGVASAFAFLVTPVGLLTVGLGVAIYQIIKFINHQKELKIQTDNVTTSYKALTEAMNQNNVAGIESEKNNLSKTEKNIQDLMNKRDELQKTLNNPNKDLSNRSSNFARSTAESDLIKTNKALEEQKQILKDSDLAFDESKGKIIALTQAESQLKNNEIAKAITDERDAIINHKNELIGLINEYQQLDSVEDKNATQKERMSQLANQLSGDINNLVLVKDAEGNVTIRNTDLLGKNIGMLNSEIDVARTNANTKMSNAKNNAQAQVGETQVLYSEITKRIAMYQAEIKAKQSALAQLDRLEKGTLTTAQQYQQYNSFRGIESLTADLTELNKAKALIDSIYGGGGGANANFGSGDSSGGGSGYTPSGGGTGSDKNSPDKVDNLDLEIDRYSKLQGVLESLNNTIDLNKKLEDQALNGDKIPLLNKEIDLLEQKKIAIANITAEQQREASELRSKLSSNGFGFDGQGEMTNYGDRMNSLVNNANAQSSADAKKNAIENVKSIEEETKRYFDLIHSEIPSSNKDWQDAVIQISSVKDSIKSVNRELLEGVKDVQDQIKEVLQKQVEDKKSKLDADLKQTEDYVNKQKEILNRQYSDQDYNKDLKKELDKKKQIEAEINKLVDDKSREAQSKLQDLRKQLEEQNQAIDDKQEQHGRDQQNQNFDDILKQKQEQADKIKEELDKKYTDENLSIIAENAIKNGYFSDVDGKIVSTQQAFIDFFSKTTDGMSAVGKVMQEEFIDKLTKAQELVKSMSDLMPNLPTNPIIANPTLIPMSIQALPNIMYPQVQMPNFSALSGSSNPISLSIDNLVNIDGNVMDTGNIKDLIIQGVQDGLTSINKYLNPNFAFR